MHENSELIMENTHFVYQDATIEFVTVAVQTCLQLEHVAESDKKEFIARMSRILPLLYLKASMLSCPERELDGDPQRFVMEEDYEMVRAGVRTLLGDDDAYLEILVEDMRYTDDIITEYISEGLADIYQELKDMAANYQTENESVMSDAVVACVEAFNEHWGQKLVNIMRPLHMLAVSDLSDETE